MPSKFFQKLGVEIWKVRPQNDRPVDYVENPAKVVSQLSAVFLVPVPLDASKDAQWFRAFFSVYSSTFLGNGGGWHCFFARLFQWWIKRNRSWTSLDEKGRKMWVLTEVRIHIIVFLTQYLTRLRLTPCIWSTPDECVFIIIAVFKFWIHLFVWKIISLDSRGGGKMGLFRWLWRRGCPFLK